MFNSRIALYCCSLLLVLGFVAAQSEITPRKCPKHETFFACGANCQTECATLNQPCTIIHKRCPDGCYCDWGYARNAAGTCIPISHCPNNY